MSSSRQIVQVSDPFRHETFDQQYWPVLMALCLTSAVLAGTIVSLMSGFWMWVSLMVLPAAAALSMISLRFVDDRKWRRSIQLGIILSLAGHCLFLILAHVLDVFAALRPDQMTETAPVRQQRMINISQQTIHQPWKEINETADLPSTVPETERQANTASQATRNRPSESNAMAASDQTQVIRRENPSQTVPKMGQNPSRVSRNTDQTVPEASVESTQPSPAPKARTEVADRPSATRSEIERQTAESPASRSEVVEAKTSESPMSESVRRRAPDESRPSPAQSSPAREVAARTDPSSTPEVADSVPSSSPNSTASPEMPSRPNAAETAVQRQQSRPVADKQTPSENVARNRPRETTSRTTPRDLQSKPAIDKALSSEMPRRSNESAEQPVSPTVAEMPSPTSTPANRPEATRIRPQAFAMDKSVNGSSGAGRAANLDRDQGSVQSPAVTSANSLDRRESTTMKPDAASLTLQQRSDMPSASADATLPSATVRADRSPVATVSSSDRVSQMTASSSASLNQSNSTASEAETSVQKGTGSVDTGSTRIVTEIAGQRVEGGGQPEINNQFSESLPAASRGGGEAVPSLNVDVTSPSVADSRSETARQQMSDRPSASADSSIEARPEQYRAESGEPDRSANNGDSSSSEPSMTASATPQGSRDDDEDEEELMSGASDPAPSENAFSNDRAITDNDAPRIENESETGAPEVRTGEPRNELSTGSAAALASQGTVKSSPNESARGRERTSPATGVAATPTPSSRTGTRESESDRPGTMTSTEPSTSSRPGNADAVPSAEGPLAEVPGQIAGATGDTQLDIKPSAMAGLDRNSPAGAMQDNDARPGPAGFGSEPDADPGINSRTASRDSPLIQSNAETRFRAPEAGGVPEINASPSVALEPFRRRGNSQAASSAPRTEEAIELGLAFLARHQQADGSWTLGGFDNDPRDRAQLMSSDTAATGLALLAFQGAGYNHREFRYASRMQSAIDWLIARQAVTGELYVLADEDSNSYARLYSHAIAALALAEAYGMTQDERLRGPAQKAMNYIAASQDTSLGGWRYRPASGSDTSVTGWMVMALHSGRLAGLEVDERVWENLKKWMEGAQDADLDYLYRYNPAAQDSDNIRRSHGRVPTPCMTAVGLLIRLYTDWDKSDPRFLAGAEYLTQHLAEDTTVEKRDTYYWYYATQLLKHVGGEPWEKWHQALHPLLVRTQVRTGSMAGSWEPFQPVADRWAPHAGRLYLTTMNLLSLEVDYRLLPIYESQ